MDGTGFHTDLYCPHCGNPLPICDPCWCQSWIARFWAWWKARRTIEEPDA